MNRDLKKFDERLQRLHQEHPGLFWLLALGIAVGFFAIAMGIKQFIDWIAP
jgi:hypothetical protein